MTNQAAQTMPVIDDFNGDNAKLVESARALISLSDSGSLAPHGIGGHARAILSAFIVRTEAAALSQTAGVAVDADEVLVALRRGEGYEDVHPQLVAEDAIDDRWPEWRIIAAAPAASGVESAASVSERARYTEQMVRDASGKAWEYMGDADVVPLGLALELVQALTQQRGDDVESAARALFEAQADPIAASWDRQWGPTKELWRKVARGNLYATTPQPSADAVREYDRELIARMLETPAVFEDASRREQARLLREADNLEADARTVVLEVPDGMVLVPARMELTPESMETLVFMLGGDPEAKDVDERWNGGTLWVGETIGDNGEKYYGLNVANVECYEEGSVPIVEFAAAIDHQQNAAQVGGEK